MPIASRVRWYLNALGVDYDLIHHDHTSSSMETAKSAHVPGGLVAKSVLLEDERGYLIAIVPASCRLQLKVLRRKLRRRLELASELELAALFHDCEVGAVPPIGRAYGVPTVIDDSLLRVPDVYFEAGDHQDLVHCSGDDFRSIVAGSPHCRFSRPH